MPTLHRKKYVENTWHAGKMYKSKCWKKLCTSLSLYSLKRLIQHKLNISTDEVHYQFMQMHLVVLSIVLISLIQTPVTNGILLPLKFLNFPIVPILRKVSFLSL